MDRFPNRLAQREAPLRRRQGRHQAVDEHGNDGGLHLRRQEMERHHDRMIDGKGLGHRQVEASLDAAVTQVETEMAARLPLTEGSKLTQIDGVGVVPSPDCGMASNAAAGSLAADGTSLLLDEGAARCAG